MHEFELIQHYFQHKNKRTDVLLGIGDDAALCQVPPDMALAVSVDTLVAGVHFPLDAMAADIGYKALAVNLSDLAAMGATPAWFTLALTLPKADEKWLHAFSEGLTELAHSADIGLIGGDTTRGPLSITVQVMGLVPAGQALRRDRARPGDWVYVTGTLGDAGLGLCVHEYALSAVHQAYVRARLHRPTPRMAWGLALRGLAQCAIDISDGLAADLGHILSRSGCGAEITLTHLPLSDALRTLPAPQAWALALGAGDDYELCFTLAPEQAARLTFPCTRIGTISAVPGLRCFDENNQLWTPPSGYRHF
jgi:thiamine-monophosphate kinase